MDPSRPSPAVEVQISLRRLASTDQAAALIPATLRYRIDDPYAVHLTFHKSKGNLNEVHWAFARELLQIGLDDFAGQGDVRVWPTAGSEGDWISLAFSSPAGHAVLEMPRIVAEVFLQRTYEVVARNYEGLYVDINAIISNLLTGNG